MNNYGFDSAAVTVLKERYMHINPDTGQQETIPEMFQRVAGYVANVEGRKPYEIEQRKKEYYEVMMSRDFMPNSPTLMNAGREGKSAQLSACYVLPIEDSMDGIFTALKNQALIHKYGGGTGFNFSTLRPKGARVSTTNGLASGPVSFMELFDMSTEKVMQGGCFKAGTLVATKKGPVPIEKLTDGTLVYTHDLKKGFVLRPCTVSFMTRKEQSIWELITDAGLSIFATRDHPFIIRPNDNKKGYQYAKLGDLTPDTELFSLNIHRNGRPDSKRKQKVLSIGNTNLKDDVWNVEVPETHNFVVCDKDMRLGVVVKNTRRGANMGILNVDHPDILEFIACKAENKNMLNNFNISVGMNDSFMQKVSDHNLNEHEQKIWGAIIDCAWENGDPGLVFFDEINRKNTTPELGELTATNPCLRGNMKILTDKSYIPIAELVGQKVNIWNGFEWSEVEPKVTGHNQKMLRITFSNGSVIDCTPYHKFIIQKIEYERESLKYVTVRKEAKELKLGDEVAPYVIKTSADDLLGAKYENVHVLSVETCEDAETVYCLSEPKRHSFIVEGVSTGNCGETPLLNFEACNLGSINLSNFVTENNDIDFEGLERTVRIAVDFLNDVIDVNQYPIPEVTEAVHLTRKIGLGVMGWADVLYKLGIRYGSDESLKLAENIMNFINAIGHEHSAGRNATITCIAPTGTISLIAGCSSGVEPQFALEYDRIAFEKENRKVLHFVNPEYQKSLETNDGRIERGVFVTAHDINFFEHIKIQAAFQKYTDLAVSKTINMRNDATKSDVERAYIYAWLSGCKGITVYRDGSRDKQVLYTLEECPDCGNKSVVNEGGCKHCTQCGWAACGI